MLRFGRPVRGQISAWLPGLLAVGVTVAALRFFDVPVSATAAFCGYLVLGLALPGLLLWRWTHRASGVLVEDVAAGTALGYAIEVLTYIPARAVGLPLLVLVPPAVTLALFTAVPGLRRYWRGSATGERTPTAWLWTMAGVWLVILFWSVKYFRLNGVTWPGNSTPDEDLPFHLSLVGEAKHHMPLMTPWVSGEPVLYHWFVYADMAATSWVTGIEPLLLLTRLSLLPMLAAFAVLIATITRRLTGRWWTGPAAVVVTLFVLAPNPYGWSLTQFYTNFGFNPIDDGSSLRLTLWTSPTETFGAMLFAPLVLVLIDLLRGRGGDRRRWVLFVVFMVAVMGGKATYLPLLMAALLFLVAVHLLVRRRLHRPSLVAMGVTFVCLLFAQFVLFGGASQGLTVDPLAIMKLSGISGTTGFTAEPKAWRLLLLTSITLFCWACIWGGIAGLGRRALRPELLLLIGLGLAGMAMILALGHPGGSQGFFLQSARPYLAIAAVCGVAALVPVVDRRVARWLLVTTVVGFAVVGILRRIGSHRVPVLSQGFGARRAAVYLVLPYAALLAVVVAAALVLWLARRRVTFATAGALLISLVAGFGLYTAAEQFATLARQGRSGGWRDVVVAGKLPYVSKGTLEAGRWLRDHSNPDDLVATNAHCLPQAGLSLCDNRHFSMSAYSERRILVEGWGFTATTHVVSERQNVDLIYVGYWKPSLQADNDAAFRSPSASTVGTLRDKYHVRWLFVDESQNKPSPALSQFAVPRFRSGYCVVYELQP